MSRIGEITKRLTRDPGQTAYFAVSGCLLLSCYLVFRLQTSPLEMVHKTDMIGVMAGVVACFAGIWQVFLSRAKDTMPSRNRAALILTLLGTVGLVNSFIGFVSIDQGSRSDYLDMVVQISGVFSYAVWPTALFLLPALRANRQKQLPRLLDVSLIVTSICAAGWYFLVAPQIDTSGGVIGIWLRIVYPIVDLVSFALVVASASLGGPYRSARGLLMAGIVCNAIGDVIQVSGIINQRAPASNAAQATWVLTACLIGGSMILINRESRQHIAAVDDRKFSPPSWLVAMIPAGFLLCLIGLASYGNWHRAGTMDSMGLNAGCLVALVLGLCRLVLIVKENNDLAGSLSRVNEGLDAEVKARTKDLLDAHIELDRQHEFLRSVIDAVPSLVFAIQPDGTVTLANAAASRFTGRPIENLTFSNYADIMAETNPTAPNIIAQESQQLLGGTEKIITEREIVAADRSTHTVEVIKTPIVSRSGVAEQILIVGNDVTIRKEAEKSLVAARDAAERSTKIKSEFLANMSHEIRTPMNGVLGFTQLLLNEDLSDEHREYVNSIKASSEHLLTIINDILDLSKLESGQLDVVLTPTVLSDLCTSTVDKHRGFALSKGLNLRLEFLMDAQMRVQSDQKRLVQVLDHLISNAIKFSEKGTISVEVARKRTSGNLHTLRFSIKDQGIGIEKTQLLQVFDPFYQADNANTRKYGGTGLGLSICKQFVRLMGGRINVESVIGQGSEFWFEITCAASEAIEPTPVDTHSDLNGLQILLVEDNIINQKVAKKLLERLGCNVNIANNGLEAVEWLLERRCDVVLMDCQMPVMDGLEATRRIRTFENARHNIPIIAVTANAMDGDREMCIAAGMDDYVPKPIKADALVNAISRLAVRDLAA